MSPEEELAYYRRAYNELQLWHCQSLQREAAWARRYQKLLNQIQSREKGAP